MNKTIINENIYTPSETVKRITELRKKKEISADMLKERCNISKNTISKSADSPNGLSAKILFSIAEALNCSVDYLLGRTDEPTANNGIKQSIGDNNSGSHNNVISIVDKPDNITAEFMEKFEGLSFSDKLELMNIVDEKSKKGDNQHEG